MRDDWTSDLWPFGRRTTWALFAWAVAFALVAVCWAAGWI